MTFDFSCVSAVPSPTLTGEVAGTAPPRVNFTTGVKFTPETVTVVLLADAESSSPVKPVTVERPLMAAARSVASAVVVFPAMEIAVLPDWTPLPESNSNTRRPPRMASSSRSPSCGIAANWIVLPRMTGWGTTAVTWAPRSSLKLRLNEPPSRNIWTGEDPSATVFSDAPIVIR